MRLIACPNCHAQYDVSQVLAEHLTCRCGQMLRNEAPKAVEAQILRCSSCGAQVGADAKTCDYCGAEIERDPGQLSLICPECYARNAENARFCTACGVPFRPEPLHVDGRELPCPVCLVLMPPTQVGGIGLNECRTCQGLWVPGDHFDLLVTRAAEARRKGDALTPPPRVSRGNPAEQRVQYRKCPECDAFMQRRNYRRSSGVIIDVCHQHGTWLDADELERIAGFILKGGHTSPMLEEEHRKTEAEAAAAAAYARMSLQRERLGIGSDPRHGDVAGGLVGFLLKILS